jgi:hypothetical protein
LIFPTAGALALPHFDEYGPRVILMTHFHKYARELLPGLRSKILLKMAWQLSV